MIADTGEPPSRGEQMAADAERPLSDLNLPIEKSWRPSNPLGSFVHAADGVRETFLSERNFRAHIILAGLAVGLGLLLHFSPLRLIVLFLITALVLTAELLNTAIEATVDLAMPKHHPLAKRAKDAASGAVLITAIFAIVIGLLLFIPALIPLVRPLLRSVSPVISASLLSGLALITVVVARLLARRNDRMRGSGTASLSREAVIGVVLVTLGVTLPYRYGTFIAPVSAVSSATASLANHSPALTPSAGVP